MRCNKNNGYLIKNEQIPLIGIISGGKPDFEAVFSTVFDAGNP